MNLGQMNATSALVLTYLSAGVVGVADTTDFEWDRGIQSWTYSSVTIIGGGKTIGVAFFQND
jgi:hypothetical protein